MKSVIELLERTVSVYGKRPAFGDENGTITFEELKEGAESVGSFLLDKMNGCVPVAFYLEKSTIAIRGMLGVVYAGGFYSIIDVRQPSVRAESVLSVLKPAVILTDKAHYEKALELNCSAECFCIEDILSFPANREELEKRVAFIQDTQPLYVNFTSGSTGIPKGVTVCHRSVLEFIEKFTTIFGIHSDDVIGNQAPFDFDVSVKDIYSALATGAKVQIIPRDYFSKPAMLMDYLADSDVTILIWAASAMCFVSIMNGFGHRVPQKVRKVMFSGEVLPIKHLNVWKTYLPDAEFVNLYGPTEITCNCTYYILHDTSYAETDILPIGKPFPNEKVFLLDEENNLVTEPGVQGEICVAGTALALGYYNDFERTNQVFVQNPLNTSYYERIYRTGDLGRYDSDGKLVYISRKDFQIKHLGHRIELGEIEAVTTARDGVSRVCCLYDNEKKRIIMFYTGEREKLDLMKDLRAVLPQFMLPNSIIRLDDMPINKNGKIDRNALKERGNQK